MDGPIPLSCVRWTLITIHHHARGVTLNVTQITLEMDRKNPSLWTFSGVVPGANFNGDCTDTTDMNQTQRELIHQCMAHMAFLEEQIEEVDRQIQDKIGSFGLSQSYALLQTVPGMKKEAAATVLAEVGANVEAFSTPAKLSSWAGVCPGNNESAGKRRTTKGNPYLRDMLLECAWASSHRKNSQMQHRYQRLQPRKGHKRVIVAVAHALIQAVYYVLSTRQPFVDTAEPPRSPTTVRRLIRHHTRRLRKLNCWLERGIRTTQTNTLQKPQITSG